ncbi:MAG: Flagellar hook-length control protein FliK [Clostridia bacterium]|nr:Flagellar hook-length control protein FliK [Clostridia bacterium]
MISMPSIGFYNIPGKTEAPNISDDNSQIIDNLGTNLPLPGKIDFQLLLLNLTKGLNETNSKIPLNLKEVFSDMLPLNAEVDTDTEKSSSTDLSSVNIKDENQSVNDLSLLQSIQITFPDYHAMNVNIKVDNEKKTETQIVKNFDTLEEPKNFLLNKNIYIRKQISTLINTSPPLPFDKAVTDSLLTETQEETVNSMQNVIKGVPITENKSMNKASALLTNADSTSISSEKISKNLSLLSLEQDKTLIGKEALEKIISDDDSKINNKAVVQLSVKAEFKEGTDAKNNIITDFNSNMKSNESVSSAGKFTFKNNGNNTDSALDNSKAFEQDTSKSKLKDSNNLDALLTVKPFSINNHFKSSEIVSIDKENLSSAVNDSYIAQQLADKTIEALNQNKNSFQMKLKPEGLGDVTVNIVFKEGQLDLKIHTELDSTKNLVENQIKYLETELKANNYSVLNLDISSGKDKSFSFENFQFNERQNNQKNNNEDNDNVNISDKNFIKRTDNVTENIIGLFTRNKLNYTI